MVYHTTPCRYLSDVSVALNAAAPVEEQLNQLFGIQTEEHKEYLAGHLKNKERVTALCHEHLGHQFPPPPSATNPFCTPPHQKRSTTTTTDNNNNNSATPAPPPTPVQLPTGVDIMDQYRESDGKLRLRNQEIGINTSTDSWSEKITGFISKNDFRLPKAVPHPLSPPPPPLLSLTTHSLLTHYSLTTLRHPNQHLVLSPLKQLRAPM